MATSRVAWSCNGLVHFSFENGPPAHEGEKWGYAYYFKIRPNYIIVPYLFFISLIKDMIVSDVFFFGFLKKTICFQNLGCLFFYFFMNYYKFFTK